MEDKFEYKHLDGCKGTITLRTTESGDLSIHDEYEIFIDENEAEFGRSMIIVDKEGADDFLTNLANTIQFHQHRRALRASKEKSHE